MSTALRVCIAAENASIRMGGEAILPFHYFRLFLERGVDVHLVTHERSRTELLALFPAHAARLHFVEDRLLQKAFFHLGKLLPSRLSEATFGLATQMLTQRNQRCVLRDLLTSCCVVHQPIPVAPRFPSLLNGLGSPLVVGPLNGGMEYPPGFQHLEPRGSRLLVHFGRTLTNIVNAFCPGKRQAAIVLVANERTRAALPNGLQGRVVLMPENGVDTSQWPPATDTPARTGRPSRFLFVGRFVAWKALDIVLDAMASAPGLALDVVGDGPMRQPWEAKSHKLGLGARVRFHGWQSQTTCAALLQTATALVLPSLYESGGAVVLEAMTAAKPVIATAWGGPTDYLDQTCGILLPPDSRTALVSGFAEAMQHLASSPDLCRELGVAGRARILASYDWQRKAEAMLAVYTSVITPL